MNGAPTGNGGVVSRPVNQKSGKSSRRDSGGRAGGSGKKKSSRKSQDHHPSGDVTPLSSLSSQWTVRGGGGIAKNLFILLSIPVWFMVLSSNSEMGRFLKRRSSESGTIAPTGKEHPALEQPPFSLLKDIFTDPSDEMLLPLGGPHGTEGHFDVPFFWHIHKTGGTFLKSFMFCLGLVQNSRINTEECNDSSDPDLKACPFGPDYRDTVINVDASTMPGIQRAKDLQLVNRIPRVLESAQHDGSSLEFPFVLSSSRVLEALDILTTPHRGRMFAILRHPVDRAVSNFYYIQIASWERNYDARFANMTLAEYIQTPRCFRNWMTRRIVGKMSGDIEVDDLHIAKEVLRRKTLVLLTSDMNGSMERLKQYFGWDNIDTTADASYQMCMDEAAKQPLNSNPHPELTPDSPEWHAIAEINTFDMELYEYALQLYQIQGELLSQRQTSRRHKKKVPRPTRKQTQGATQIPQSPTLQEPPPGTLPAPQVIPNPLPEQPQVQQQQPPPPPQPLQ